MQQNLYFNSLEELDLSFNLIKKLNKIDIKTLKYLDLMNNEISEGLLDFLDNLLYSRHLIEKLMLKKDNNALIFKYYDSNYLLMDFKFPIEEKNMNETLKTISFKQIKNLEIGEFNDLEWLTNESLENLEILNFKRKINDISIFNIVNFMNLKKIVFFDNEPITEGFNSLNVFPSINLVSIKIEKINNNYKCYLSCVNPEIKHSFIFDDLNFLKEKFLGNQNKDLTIDIAQEILDDKNNSDFFSYNEIINSFPIFKNLNAEILDINFFDDKYLCITKFYHHKFRINFVFDNLNFFNDSMFKKIEKLDLQNKVFNENIGITKETFPKLKKLNLKNNIIKSMKFFSEVEYLESFLRLTFNLNECSCELLEFFDDKKFSMEKITAEGNRIKIDYKKPFNFYLFIDKIDKIKYFNGCREIILNNLQLGDNDIKFLDNKTLSYLDTLNLDGNNITNLNILKYIEPLQLRNLSLKNNLINSANESVKKIDYEIESIEVKLKENEQSNHIISFSCQKYNYYKFYFDYSCDINENSDIFKELIFKKDYRLNLSGIKLKNLNFMESENLKNLSELVLDNNLIDDISVFEKINYNINLSLKQNPIRKGLHAIKSSFFRCTYLELEIEKKENEYKIFSSFKNPYIDIEFYINNIIEIKDIFDFVNDYIILKNVNEDILKILEDNSIKCKSDSKEITIVDFLDFFEKHKTINIARKIGDFKLIENNDIILNSNNNQSLKNIFISFKRGTAHYSIFELNLIDLESDDEELIQCLTFLNITNLKLLHCNLNLNVLKDFTITNLDLSSTTVTDITGICKLTELKKLNLSNNCNISNLYELKDAKFKKLKELYLSNDNLGDLNEIKMSDYKFDDLEILDLRNNRIQNITPIKRTFKSLKKLYLENNIIREDPIFKEMFQSTSIYFNMWDLGTHIK